MERHVEAITTSFNTVARELIADGTWHPVIYFKSPKESNKLYQFQRSLTSERKVKFQLTEYRPTTSEEMSGHVHIFDLRNWHGGQQNRLVFTEWEPTESLVTLHRKRSAAIANWIIDNVFNVISDPKQKVQIDGLCAYVLI